MKRAEVQDIIVRVEKEEKRREISFRYISAESGMKRATQLSFSLPFLSVCMYGFRSKTASVPDSAPVSAGFRLFCLWMRRSARQRKVGMWLWGVAAVMADPSTAVTARNPQYGDRPDGVFGELTSRVSWPQ